MKYPLLAEIFLPLSLFFVLVDNKILSRKKRYVAFPEGSSFSAVFCMTAQMGITDGAAIFSEGVNWGLSYELPNDTRPFKNYYKPKAAMQRRHRRDLYGKMESIMNSMGYNGRSCILRSLCEASYRLEPRENSLLYQILSIIFRFPEAKISDTEPDLHRVYHWAAKKGIESVGEEKCSDIFNCPFSLIDMALGYYSFNGM